MAHYYPSKTLIMALLGVVGVFLMVFVGTGVSVNMSYVLTGTFLCSVVYTLLGIAISAEYRYLDDYFVPILAVGLALPLRSLP